MTMMVVLCDSFDDARYAFSEFMDFLETFDPFLIEKVYEFSYCVETVEGIRYIFVDYRFEPMFNKMGNADCIGADEFFEDFGEPYFRPVLDYLEMGERVRSNGGLIWDVQSVGN